MGLLNNHYYGIIMGLSWLIWLVVTATWLSDDFPETVGNGIMIPTDELHHFSDG